MNNFNFTDSVTLQDVKTLKDGYKAVRGRIARTGMQSYLRHEFGDAAPMGDSNDVLTIYRPDDEVFADSAVNGWAHVPVTLDHPAALVTPDNVRDYAVGEVSAKARLDRENGWIELEYIVKDASAISAMMDTHVEVSGGYLADVDFTPGFTVDGVKYDGVQRGIVPNHLALVPKGRAFSDAATAVNWGATPQPQKDHVLMTMKTIVVGDTAVQVAADDADVITKMIADNSATVDALNETIGELKAENAETAAKVLSEDKIEALIADRLAVTDKARTFVADYDATGKTVAAIKREVVAHVYGDDAATVEVTDAEIKGVFNIMKADTVADKLAVALSDKVKQTNDAWVNASAKLKGIK